MVGAATPVRLRKLPQRTAKIKAGQRIVADLKPTDRAAKLDPRPQTASANPLYSEPEPPARCWAAASVLRLDGFAGLGRGSGGGIVRASDQPMDFT